MRGLSALRPPLTPSLRLLAEGRGARGAARPRLRPALRRPGRAKLIAQPNLKPAPEDRAEPYRFYSSDDGRTSYLITKPGAPGHPAIMMQRAEGGTVTTTGCPYGDHKAYDKLLAYLEGLKEWHR